MLCFAVGFKCCTFKDTDTQEGKVEEEKRKGNYPLLLDQPFKLNDKIGYMVPRKIMLQLKQFTLTRKLKMLRVGNMLNETINNSSIWSL